MELGLEGKTVIVTGGASNIGRGISFGFAKEKCNVVIADIDEVQGNKVAREAKAQGAKGAICIKCDVTSWDQVQSMAKKTLEEFGTIDVLVNNVGWGLNGYFVDKPREVIEKEIQLNLWGNINCTRAVLDHMIQRSKGAIVSIGSDAGRMGEFRAAIYSACKGAVIAFSKALARELGPKYGIRINVVCPGSTVPESPDYVSKVSMWAPGSPGATRMTPEMKQKVAQNYVLRKLGTPEDIAHAVVFLASDVASGDTTGQTFSVSGGYTMM